ILIVIVGSMFAVMVKFELGQFLGAVKVAAKAFSFKLSKPEKIIEEVVEMAGMARKGGLLSLEGREVSDEFLGKGIQLLVDGHDPDVRSEEHTSELQSRENLVCRLLLEKTQRKA